jgi:glycerol-3-phosphate acyltransferase PlsY
MPEFNPVLFLQIVLSFALGSIPFAVISMWGTGVDILQFGSGNPGFNNVLRYSKWRSVICLIGDAGKGVLPMVLFATSEVTGWLFGMAAVFGHCFSPFLKFNGGKGIATSAGVMLYLYPRILLPCVALYILLRFIGARLQWRERGTIASLSASALFVLLLLLWQSPRMAALGVALLLFVAWRHKKNFQALATRVDPH